MYPMNSSVDWLMGIMAKMTTGRGLPARRSRGTRIHKLIGEEAEADEVFWGQSAWAEDEEDADYSTEDEEEDVVDSDFDEEEAPDEEVHDADEDEDGAKRRRRRANPAIKRVPIKTQAPRPPKRARTSSTGTSEATGATPLTPTSYEMPTLRQSTARKTSESSELRKKILEEAARLAEKAKKPVVVKTELTQEQLLVEAVRTEVENTQSLNRLEQLEEEKKAENATAPKAPFTGRMVRYHSRIGVPKTITFLNTDEFPALFRQTKPTKRVRGVRREKRVEKDSDDEEQEREENGTKTEMTTTPIDTQVVVA